ncbi:MAG: dockerin, partial [Saprospirales bacterium]
MCTYTLKAQELVINEVMASNGNTLADEDGDYEDWIELYNAGDEVVNLEGWGLSDDYGQPFRWLLPAVELRPGEHLVIWASNKDRNDPDGELHTNFAISSSGEEVILTRPDGERIDEVEPRAIPRDLSWGRFPDGTDNWFYFESATPGHPNANPSFSGIVEPPTFSHQPGFYTEPFLLEISHPDTKVTIYYTTDGSNPTTESQQYTGPIEIYDRSGEENVYSM